MIRTVRAIYAVLAWVFVFGLLVQVFLIGQFLFSDRNAINAHRDLGWLLHIAPLPILVFAYLARTGRRDSRWALGLALVVFVVPLLVMLRDSSPVAAALHPVGAMLAFALAVLVAVNAYRALRLPATHTDKGDRVAHIRSGPT